MKYILIENIAYQGQQFYSFESEKGQEELEKELAEFLCEGDYSKSFYGHRSLYSSIMNYTIVSLEEFWKDYLPS